MENKKGVLKMNIRTEQAVFMNKVRLEVWARLEKTGMVFNMGEINDHFKNMLENPDIQTEVEDVFFDRFINL